MTDAVFAVNNAVYNARYLADAACTSIGSFVYGCDYDLDTIDRDIDVLADALALALGTIATETDPGVSDLSVNLERYLWESVDDMMASVDSVVYNLIDPDPDWEDIGDLLTEEE